METIRFDIYSNKEIESTIANKFIELLAEQGKVTKPSIQRIQSCRKLVFCKYNNKNVAIGAIKTKTSSDFESKKANLKTFAGDFTWEIGYFYVQEEFRGLGLSTLIFRILNRELLNENMMATTELFAKNPMKILLEKNGFILQGKPWKSTLHDGYLGLFLRFKKSEE